MHEWRNRGTIEILLVLGVVVFSLFLIGGFGTMSSNTSPTDNATYNVDENALSANGISDQSLQLKTFTGTKTTPPPAPVPDQPPPSLPPPGSPPPSPPPSSCGVGFEPGTNISYGSGRVDLGSRGGRTDNFAICDNGCISDGVQRPGLSCCPGVISMPGKTDDGSNIIWCDAKPVIYLYPEKVASVSVKVEIPGKITVSIPKYNNGWNVTAYPDGTLVSNGQKYSELFYETSQTADTPPSKGWVVKKSELKTKLTEITTKLGLNTKEQSEFMDYWLPRLNTLNKPYYFVSFFENKDEVDKVTITPTPDNFIGFIMYFKGLNKNTKVQTPSYPSVPQRTGFTAVEWGGIVEY